MIKEYTVKKLFGHEGEVVTPSTPQDQIQAIPQEKLDALVATGSLEVYERDENAPAAAGVSTAPRTPAPRTAPKPGAPVRES